MEFPALQTLSLPFVVQDVFVAVGAGVALLAGLVFLNLGLVLPGLLTSLGGPPPDQRGAYLEFGPAARPLISDPAPPRDGPGGRERPEAGSAGAALEPHSRNTGSHLTPPTLKVSR